MVAHRKSVRLQRYLYKKKIFMHIKISNVDLFNY